MPLRYRDLQNAVRTRAGDLLDCLQIGPEIRSALADPSQLFFTNAGDLKSLPCSARSDIVAADHMRACLTNAPNGRVAPMKGSFSCSRIDPPVDPSASSGGKAKLSRSLPRRQQALHCFGLPPWGCLLLEKPAYAYYPDPSAVKKRIRGRQKTRRGALASGWVRPEDKHSTGRPMGMS